MKLQNIVEMCATRIGIVMEKDVTLVNIVTEFLEDFTGRIGDRKDVKRVVAVALGNIASVATD